MSGFSPACGAPACGRISFSPAWSTMLTIEDGSIVSGANSYAEIADVTAYATLYGWSFSGTSTAQEQAILRSMIYIESFEDRFCGGRVSASQALSWPREYVPDAKGTGYLDSDAIPSGLVNALCEAAILELATPGVLTATIDADDIGVRRTRDKIGPMETEVEYGNRNSAQRSKYIRILEFLKPYLCSGTGFSGRVVRA